MNKRILILIIILLTTSVVILLITNKNTFSQSIVIGTGAQLNLGSGTDVCASTYGNITGNVTGSGYQCAQPLPVEMISFSASVNVSNVVLAWQTSFEINNLGFEIYRSGKNNTSERNKIGFVNGGGTRNIQANYTYTDSKLSTGKYYYRLKQIDNNGNMQYYNLNNLVEIKPGNKFELSQNYPNPFNPVTKIDFVIPYDSRVTLKIFDISGREVYTIINNELKTADNYSVSFNATNLSSGIYFYKLISDKITIVQKMIVIK